MRFGPVGGWEILIILVVVLLLFGSSRLPRIAKGLGESARELRKSFQDLKNDIEDDEGQSGTTSSPTTKEPEKGSSGT